MMKLFRPFIVLALILAVVYAGYELGRRNARQQAQTQLIENYSFVRDIAELAALEANGTTTYTSTNLANDGSWTDAFRRTFLENTVQISLPYTAKYGVDLQDSSMRIIRRDSLVEIYLPQPKLLSFELRLDRIEASSNKGWLLAAQDDHYLPFQKKLYAQTRAQLAQNQVYLEGARERIRHMMTRYFLSLHLQSRCVFESTSGTVNIPND